MDDDVLGRREARLERDRLRPGRVLGTLALVYLGCCVLAMLGSMGTSLMALAHTFSTRSCMVLAVYLVGYVWFPASALAAGWLALRRRISRQWLVAVFLPAWVAALAALLLPDLL